MNGNSNSTAEEKIEFLRTLRATRRFTSQPVPEEAINAILEVARWSGSASNSQPWEFIVIRDPQTLQAFSGLEGYTHMAGAAFGMVIVMEGKNANMESYDEGRLTERILLAAKAYGIGAGIGWLRGDGMQGVKSLLGIPEDRSVRTTIGFGYPDDSASQSSQKPAQARKPLSELVHIDKY